MEYLLTTIDNPFNPFTDYDEWYKYDVDKGYYTCAYLARITNSSDELSDTDQLIAIDQAMNDIVKYNVLGIYCKIDRNYVIKQNVSIENINLDTVSV
jgi:hypothetical protein